jgi:hypothetical protein
VKCDPLHQLKYIGDLGAETPNNNGKIGEYDTESQLRVLREA